MPQQNCYRQRSTEKKNKRKRSIVILSGDRNKRVCGGPIGLCGETPLRVLICRPIRGLTSRSNCKTGDDTRQLELCVITTNQIKCRLLCAFYRHVNYFLCSFQVDIEVAPASSDSARRFLIFQSNRFLSSSPPLSYGVI